MEKQSNLEGRRRLPIGLAKPGYIYILLAAAVTLILFWLDQVVVGMLGVAVTLFVCWFFRDPERGVPPDGKAIVSPADGKVITIGPSHDPDYYEGECQKISIFMSVFNVHVNRIPIEGRVYKIRYQPGKFFAANLDKASKENEHNAVFIQAPDALKVCMVQIAGLIAKRIVCHIRENDVVARGQRFGMICFGSRVDLYLPKSVTLNVQIGDKVKAGTSILGFSQ